MKHNESFWQNSIVFCGQEHLLYRFVGYWCAWVMQILSIRDVWFGRPSWSHRRQQLLRQLLTFSFSAITWLVIFFLLRSCEQCNLWKDRITTIKICLVHNAVLIQRCPKHQNCSQVLNKREKAGGDAPAPTDVASPAKDAGTPAVDVSKEATRLGKWGQGYNLYNGIPNNLSLGMVYYWLWDIHWDQKLQTLVIYCACCRSPMFCHPHSHHLLLKRLGITLSHVKRVQTLCPAGSFGHLWTVESCGVCLKVPLIPESNSKARSVRSSVEFHWNSQILSLVYLAGSGNWSWADRRQVGHIDQKDQQCQGPVLLKIFLALPVLHVLYVLLSCWLWYVHCHFIHTRLDNFIIVDTW